MITHKPEKFFVRPIIGQEAICPDGLGRVVAFLDTPQEQWVQVNTYINNRSCRWAPHNVRLVDIGPTCSVV